MTETATFKGTYSDIKNVRSRKVTQIIVEIPIEQYADFVKVFGGPDPAEEKWIALALLKDVSRETSNEKRKFEDLPPTQQAALACKREAFQTYCGGFDECTNGAYNCALEDDVADFVRVRCGIESRAELNTNEHAAAKWEQLYHNFTFWLADAEHG